MEVEVYPAEKRKRIRDVIFSKRFLFNCLIAGLFGLIGGYLAGPLGVYIAGSFGYFGVMIKNLLINAVL